MLASINILYCDEIIIYETCFIKKKKMLLNELPKVKSENNYFIPKVLRVI